MKNARHGLAFSLPQLAARFDLARLITRYPLEEANQALADMASGSVMKAVLVPDSLDFTASA